MKRLAAVAASARRAIAQVSLAGVVLGYTGAAAAGDRALFDAIGYSPDARYFAFEEFGIEDGSGFAYSNVYVIDIEADTWARGTPVRVRIEEEPAELSDARQEARAEAAAVLSGLRAPAEAWALIGDGEMNAEAKSLQFGPPGYEPGTVLASYGLRLETFEAKAPDPCQDWFSQAPLGYALTLTGDDGEHLVHRDDRIPRSRGCPLDYRIYAVFAPMHATDLDAAVAILSVYPGGFEGPDRRFLAVPLNK